MNEPEVLLNQLEQVETGVDEPCGSEACEEAMEAAKEKSDEGMDSNTSIIA